MSEYLTNSIFVTTLVFLAIICISPTQAFYNDTEHAKENGFRAGTLDLELGGAKEKDNVFVLTPENAGVLQLTNIVHVEEVGTSASSFCGDVLASINGGPAVPLFSLPSVMDEVLESGESSSYVIEYTLGTPGADYSGEQCRFTYVFEASQEGMVYGEGYHDREEYTIVLNGDNLSCTSEDSDCTFCLGDVEVIHENSADITNIIFNFSNTGGNFVGFGGSIFTGNAGTSTTVTNIVNTNTTILGGKKKKSTQTPPTEQEGVGSVPVENTEEPVLEEVVTAEADVLPAPEPVEEAPEETEGMPDVTEPTE